MCMLGKRNGIKGGQSAWYIYPRVDVELWSDQNVFKWRKSKMAKKYYKVAISCLFQGIITLLKIVKWGFRARGII